MSAVLTLKFAIKLLHPVIVIYVYCMCVCVCVSQGWLCFWNPIRLIIVIIWLLLLMNLIIVISKLELNSSLKFLQNSSSASKRVQNRFMYMLVYILNCKTRTPAARRKRNLTTVSFIKIWSICFFFPSHSKVFLLSYSWMRSSDRTLR